MTRRQSLLIRTFALWTLYVWVTRMWNIWRDHAHGAGFKLVHTVLAVVSVTLAVAAWRVVTQVQRRGQPERATTGP